MLYFLIALLGLVIGSFLNVCIYRIEKEESISFPPSHCTSCNHRLGIKDLIPVLSFVILKGKCRYCNEKISLQYPIIEVINTIFYLLIFNKYGLSFYTIKFCILVSLLIVIGVIDYRTQYVYRSTTLFGGIVGVIFIIYEYFLYKSGAIDLILGGLIGFVIIGLIVFITKGMGEGDIEIATICGLFIGVKYILLSLFLAIIIGGIIGIIIVTLNLKKIKDRIAFGPFIAIGVVLSILYGQKIIEIYMKLLNI